MEKINFQDNITKANAETMTQFQDNIENAINEIGSDTGWIESTTLNPGDLGTSSGSSTGTLYGRKIGNIVQLNFDLVITSTYVYTLNENFRPTQKIYGVLTLDSGVYTQELISIDTDGTINLLSEAEEDITSAPQSLNLRGNIMYFV